MGFLRFYRQVVATAARHSLSTAQDVLFGSIVVVALVAIVMQRIGVHFDVAHWLTAISSWQIALGVLFCIVSVRLVMAPYWMHKDLEKKIADSESNRVRLEVVNVRFDPNGSSEIYIQFRISNPGEATTIRNWEIETLNKSGDTVKLYHRNITLDKYRTHPLNPNVIMSHDISKEPINKGEVISGELIFSITGANAKELFGYYNNVFKIKVTDIRKNIIIGQYRYGIS
jgi:hypothetical protein